MAYSLFYIFDNKYKKLQLEIFYTTNTKKDWVQEQGQKKLVIWKAQECSLNVWYKTESLGNKPRSGRPFVVEDEALLDTIEQ